MVQGNEGDKMKILILLIGLITCLPAQASDLCEGETWVTFEMVSQHWKGRQGKNQSHHRRGIGCGKYFLSTYKGSYGDRITSFEIIERDYFKCWANGVCLGHRYGIYHGYEKLGKIIPTWMPNFSYKVDDHFGIDVACFPSK